jgi:hypothetical protein
MKMHVEINPFSAIGSRVVNSICTPCRKVRVVNVHDGEERSDTSEAGRELHRIPSDRSHSKNAAGRFRHQREAS